MGNLIRVWFFQMVPLPTVLLFSFFYLVASHSILQLPSQGKPSAHLLLPGDDGLFCESWRFSVETNDAGIWGKVPLRCAKYVEDYCTGDRYASDSAIVADDSYVFASGVDMVGDGKDVWIFDIDETLLSNIPYYAAHGFGTEEFNETAFNEWTNLARAPALPASLKLYKELLSLGYRVVLLTGRDEFQRNSTMDNLAFAGYTDWDRLILRGPGDKGKRAVTYKSEKRKELLAEGFRILGNSGDQWSDLLGIPMAARSFKLPNPMYYIA